MNMYEWLKMAYPNGLCTLDQCKRAVAKKKLTEEQYKEITGYTYPEPLEKQK